MLIRQTILYLPAQIVAPLVQFASVLIWSHLLAPQQLGVVTLLVAVQEISYLLFFGWWSMSMLRFISSYMEPAARRDFLGSELVAMLGAAALQSLALVPVLILAFPGLLGPETVVLALVYMVTRSVNDYLVDRARAEARIALYTLVQTVGPVMGFLVGLLGIWRLGPSAHAVLAGFVVAQMIGITSSLILSDFCRSLHGGSRVILKQAIGFGGLQSIARLLAVVAINAPRLILAATLGVSAVGMFAVGYSLGIRASSFAVTLVTAGAYPLVVKKMNQEGPEAAFRQLSQNMVLVALVVAPVAFGLIGVNASVVHLLVDKQYQAVTLAVLPLATVGGLFRYLRAHTSDQVFLLNLKPGYGNWVALVDLIVAAGSVWIGVQWLGVVGAALGPMVAGLATFVMSFALSRFRFGFHAPLGAFARIGAAGAIMGAVVYAFPVASNPLWLGVQVALGGIVYVGLTLLFMPAERSTLLGMFAAKTGRFSRNKEA
jgi:O-antigen/teichoic acid export membrane protein